LPVLVATIITVIIIQIFPDLPTKISYIILPVAYLIFFILNNILLQYFTGKTLEKYITHTKLVSATTRKLTIKQIIIRELTLFIPFGGLTYLKSRFPRGLHDNLSHTKVIYEGDPKDFEKEGTSALAPDLTKKVDKARFLVLILILTVSIIIYLLVKSSS
jgi:hypothetical protein